MVATAPDSFLKRSYAFPQQRTLLDPSWPTPGKRPPTFGIDVSNWTKTIEGFDKRGADGIPPSLYSQTDAAVNILRFMKTQFTPDVK